jgi:protein TonB
MLFSLAVHAYALFGVSLILPSRSSAEKMQPMHVVLVNSKSKSRPVSADAMAQANLDGGGNTEEDRQAKTMLPNVGDDTQITPEQAAKQVAHLEEESKRMQTALKNNYSLPQAQAKKQQNADTVSGDDLIQKSLEIARLEAQINKNNEYYQKLPRRKFIGARTQEYRYAQYIEDWRVKIERFGNLNYPEQARHDQIFGKVRVSVSIKADGSIEKIEVDQPSGQRLLDAAAVRLVKLAGPFSPLPPDISKDIDVLTITRTWSFTLSNKLESE